ncbi:hypothetical protein PG997_007038 [Apiospora hydei]|uniref:F-box domain-containing protein n=1 Tax=Apiospora hydei TaxID=1337664 RepID=A0ABR1WQL0_9PEZI
MSPLEDLPAELRSLLLWNIPDLSSLRSLVHASPVFHAQYRADRDGILRACMGRDMDGFFIDAWATTRTRVSVMGSPRTFQQVTQFFSSYYSAAPINVDSMSSGCLCWLSAFHINVARPFAKLYTNWALANLKIAALSSPKKQQDAGTAAAEIDNGKTSSLSRSEEVRVLKAIYQYQTHHNLFGRNEARYDQTYVKHDLAVRFYNKFEPWEVEAIGCINVFLQDAYEVVFDEVKGELITLRQHFAIMAPTSFGPCDPDGPSPFAFMSTSSPFFIMTLLLRQRACMAFQIKEKRY